MKKIFYKNRQMCKKETFFVRFVGLLLLMTSLQGDISVGIMKKIDNNANVYLLYNNVPVACAPFGVIPLEKMGENAPNPTECLAQIEQFYRSSPHDKVFAKEHMHINQSYHFELISKGCILYANGLETYSEMLLARGIALVDPEFNDPEWTGRLLRAQKGAENLVHGLHATQIRKACIKEKK